MAMDLDVNATDVAFLRFFCNFLLATVQCAIMCENCFLGLSKFPGTLFWRSITGLITCFGMLYGCAILPLFLSNILFNTKAIWASLLAWAILSEPIRKNDIIAIVVCLIGVGVISFSPAAKVGKGSFLKTHDLHKFVQPAVNKSVNATAVKDEKAAKDEGSYVFALICCMVAAVSEAMNGVFTREVKKLPHYTIIFAYSGYAAIFLFIFLFTEYCIHSWG